jgi:divalent metal cation (Fe/Co/Zn/Cd) transporter
MSIIVMPVLFYLKHRTGKALGSKSLIADAKETLACLFLSIAVLLGILLNFFSGFWQADPIAAIVIAIYLVIEGIRSLKMV